MLVFSTCKRVQGWVDAAVRSELDASGQQLVAAHISACGECAQVHGEAVLAFQVVRQAVHSGAMEPAFSDEQLAAMRSVTLAAIANVANDAAVESAGGWRRGQGRALLSGLAAASVAALALLGGPSATMPARLAPAIASAELAAVTSDLDAAEVSISTSNTAEGTRLSWQREGSYRVVRSDSPNRRGGGITVSVVCGTSWTDLERPNGLVYYRVIADAPTCPPDHA